MNARLNLVENYLTLGRLDEAWRQLAAVEPTVRKPDPSRAFMQWRYGQRYLHDCGEYWLARGDPARAAQLAAECRDWAERSRSRKNIGKARRLLGRALLVEGRLEEARGELDAAVALAQSVGSPPQIWLSWAALGDLHAAEGRPDDAARAYGRALDVMDATAGRLSDPERREIFLGSPAVQMIRRRAANSVPPRHCP
jgi:tetratricopeptide (TPR) repeat protein